MTAALRLRRRHPALASGPAVVQSSAETSARLDALFGDHKPYEEVLRALKGAVAAGDHQTVAAMIAYPLTTTIAASG